MKKQENNNKAKPQKLKEIIIQDRETKKTIIAFKPCKQTEARALNFEAMGCTVIRVYE